MARSFMRNGGVPQFFGDRTYEEIVQMLEGARRSADQLAESLRNGTSIDVSNDKAQLDALTRSINQLERAKQVLDAELARPVIIDYNDAITQLDNLYQRANTLREMLRDGTSFDFNLDSQELKNVTAQIRELESVVKNIRSFNNYTLVEPQNIGELNSFIEVYKERIRELKEYLRSGETGDVFEQDMKQLAQYEQELKRLEGLKKDFGNQPMSYSDAKARMKELKGQIKDEKRGYKSTGDIEEQQKQVKELEDEYKRLSQIVEQAKSVSFGAKLMSALPKVADAVKNIGNAFNSISNVVSNVVGNIKGSIQSLTGVIHSVLSSVRDLASKGFDALKNAVSTTLGNMKSLVSGGFNAVVKGVGAVKSGLSTIRSHIQFIVKKGTPNLMKSFSSLKSMLMRRIKRTFISSIFNQAKEGLQSLAKFDSGFNKTMSNIKNGAKQASGNLAGLLGNLITALEPAIMTVINLLSDLFAKANAVLALITGKATIAVAKKGTDNYAKSLQKASGAAKDLNHQLYGFDEITRQEDNNSNGSSGITYEQQAIDGVLGNLKAIFEEIKEAFINGEFEKVGSLIADQLNNIVTKVDDFINDLRPKAVEWTSNIARILNGMLKPELFENIGKTIGDGINLVFDVFNKFLTTFHFDEFGQMVAIGINSIFNTVDWGLIGETIGNSFNAVWDFFGNLFERLDWQDIGYKLSLAVGNIFNTIDWKKYTKMISEGINGVFLTLYTFIDGIDWAKIANDIMTNLTDLINNKIDWTLIGETLLSAIKALQSIFHELVSSDFFVSLASRLGELVGGVLNRINWQQLASDILVGLAKLRTAFWTLINKINLPNLAKELASAINGLLTDPEVKKAWDDSDKAVIEGVNGIIDSFKELVSDENGIKLTEIAEELGTRIGELLSSIKWEDLVDAILMGAFKLRTAFWTFVDNLQLPNTASRIAQGVNDFFKSNTGSSIFEEANDAAKKGFDSLIEAFANLTNESKGGIQFSTIATEIANGINTFFEKGSDGESSMQKAIAAVGTFVTDLGGAFSELLLKINLSAIRQSIADGINTVISSQKLSGIITNIGTFVDNAATEFARLMGGKEQGGIDFEGLATEMANGINGLFRDESRQVDMTKVRKLGEAIGNGIKSIIENISTFIKETDFTAIGEAIGTFLAGIDWVGIAGRLIELLINALEGALSLVGGLTAGFIRQLLGINDDEQIDASAHEWAEKVSKATGESMEDAMEREFTGSRAENIAKLAAMSASKVNEGFLQELISTESELERGAQEYTDTFLLRLQDALENPRGLSQEDIAKSIAHVFEQGDSELTEKVAKGKAEYFLEQLQDAIESSNGEIDIQKVVVEAIESSSSANELAQKLSELGIEITDNMAESMLKGRDGIGKAGDLLWEQLVKSSSINDTKEAFKNAGIEITDEFAKSITGAGKENIAAALELMGAGLDDSTIALLDSINLSERLDNFMRESGASLTEVVASLMLESGKDIEEINKELGYNAGELIAENLPKGVAEGLGSSEKALKEAANNAKEAAKFTETEKTELNESGADAGKQTGKGFADETEDGKQNVIDKTEDVTSAVQEKYEALPDEVKPYAEQLMEYIVTALSDGDGTVKSAIEAVAQSAVDRAKEILASDVGITIGENFIDGIRDGMENSRRSVFDKAEYIATYAKEYVESNLNYSEGYSIGENMIIGLYNGFHSYSQDLVDFVAHVCGTCASTARKILGIESPSKVFAQIGSYTMEGMQIGLEKEGKNAVSTVADVANAMTEEGSDASLNYMTDGLDTVADKLSRIANIFSDIADVITEMGGLQIPTIATGQVIPYRTQLEANPSSTSTDETNVEDAIYNALMRAMGTSNNEQDINITLQIDGRKMADIVSKYQRQQNRAWGV